MHKEELKIPSSHSLIQTKTEWNQKRGQDTDTYWYDEVDAEGKIIAKYIVKDSTSIYPPFKKNITFEKEIIK
ncbi:hypothetical protein [Aliarcobacter skirrowii]|uniref:hypothetical protein n=1 Tax=Aliarcobacter skirrowii TaxID=28200 RepID=UPI002A36C0F2|nr:hypothetical protein [Aliarcobacter skirrowii]MDY0180598.1 hypothetical protein [Aliarcobacter skirrowii]